MRPKLTKTFSMLPHVYTWEDSANMNLQEDFVFISLNEPNEDSVYIEVYMNTKGAHLTFCGYGDTIEEAENFLETEYDAHLEAEYGGKRPESKIWPELEDFLDLTKTPMMDDSTYAIWAPRFKESLKNLETLFANNNREVYTITEWEGIYKSVEQTPENVAYYRDNNIQTYPDINAENFNDRMLIQTGTKQTTTLYFRKNNIIYTGHIDYDNKKIVFKPFNCGVNKLLSFFGMKPSSKTDIVNKWLFEQKGQLDKKFTKTELQRVLSFLE